MIRYILVSMSAHALQELYLASFGSVSKLKNKMNKKVQTMLDDQGDDCSGFNTY